MSRLGRWSLRRRLTVGFTAITSLLALAVAGIAALFLGTTVEEAVDALVREELAEARVRLEGTEPDQSRLDSVLATLQGHHPANALAARLWIGGDGAVRVIESGAPSLLSSRVPAPEPSPGDSVQRDGDSLRWRTEVVDDRLRLGVVVDGSAQQKVLGQFAFAALGLGAVAVVLGLGWGALAAQFASSLLERVARGARNVRSSSDGSAFDFPDAPAELQDVTQALGEMLAQLAAQRERARLVIAGLAHELGAPLQNLLAEAEVALLRERTLPEYQRSMEHQRDELLEASRALRNLVAYVSLDPPSEPGAERFDLAADVERRLQRERSRAARRDIALVRTGTDVLEVSGERESIGLAVQNLVANAIDWSPPGGTVDVHVERTASGWQVAVEDEGPGVSEEDRERIFLPLERGRGAPARRRGFGLGLAIARGAARAHGGDVSVTSTAAGGSRFVLHVPDVRTRGEPGAPARAASGT